MTFRSALSVCLGLALSMALLGLPPPATATVLTEINGLIMNDASANADVTLVQLDMSDDFTVGAFNADINNVNDNAVAAMAITQNNPGNTDAAGTFDKKKDLTQLVDQTSNVEATTQNLNRVLGVAVASATHSSAQVLAGAQGIYELAPNLVAPGNEIEARCRDVIVAVLAV